MTLDIANYILRNNYFLLTKEHNFILNKLHFVQDYYNLLLGIEDEKLKNKVLIDLELKLIDLVDYSPDKNDYFKIKIANEVWELHSDKIKFNICPVCGELARTPIARQAKCGHTW